MFGGLRFLLDGNLLVCVWKDSLIVCLGLEASDEALEEQHVRVFDVTGRLMKGWVMIESEGLDEDEQVRQWVQRALRFVETLLPKS